MHNMFHENAEHGKILHRFGLLLGSRSQPVLNGWRYPQVNWKLLKHDLDSFKRIRLLLLLNHILGLIG